MNKYFVLLILLALYLGGCAPKHFVAKDSDLLTFFLQNGEAKRVQFASSYDRYLLHDATQNSSGVWQIEVPASLELKYFYIVDGSMYVPECRLKERDDFGSENCLYIF
ncbi:MAG: hypothetical protein KAU22_09605 [Desulfuromonadales bacterium]|nr:hypothetical protein [Desulfuromonadales bacterium]